MTRSLTAVLAAPVAALCAGCASLATHSVLPVGGTLRLPLSDFPALAEPGGSIRIRAAGSEDALVVLSLGGAAYSALSPTCTHLGCAVDVRGAYLVCPCHGSTYDREGRVLRGPAERPLTRYPAVLRDEVLIVSLEGLA